MSPRAALVLCLLLPWLARAAPPEEGSRLPVLERVAVREHSESSPGLGLELTFERLPPDPALARFSVEDARAFIEALEAGFQVPRPPSGPPPAKRFLLGAAMTGTLLGPPPDARSSSDLERQVRSGYEELFGASSLPLPSSLENSRWFQALKLSPRYMGEGVREAALAMLSSPAVAYSLAVSMMLYMAAWAAPEPVFSKAFAAAVTLGLLMTYSATELYTVGMACLNLYREAEAARTPEQLEAVAERFGKAMGGVGFRVLVTVAGAKLAKGLPEVPRGGMWGRLSPPRFAFAGGASRGSFIVGAGTRAQVSVANGTVVLMGVSAGTTSAAASAAVAASRTTGACREEPGKDDAKSHHIATNKNDVAEVRGGPWTPVFEDVFEKAGMSLVDPANIVHLVGHQGPHPEEYHREVYRLLSDAVDKCQTRAECKRKLIEALDEIAGNICKPGSKLNKLLTRKP
ncbi:AHH domain-containing protein [Archangium sp.]|uniref:AHH domain-containing protein n=1 Tax=Archangium sp. TaxID=1872627 RepID=UPI00389A727E